MNYYFKYNSPLGEIIMKGDEIGLSSLQFEDFNNSYELKETEVFKKTIKWLNLYFKGIEPNFNIPLNLSETNFQKEVREIIQKIPFGKTLTYGEIAEIIAKKRNIKKMSNRAVGAALSKNPVLIIIPCHRVIGKNGSITGYRAGVKIKEELLKLEKNKGLGLK